MKESWRSYNYLVLWVILIMLLVIFDPQKSEGCVESERLGLLEIKSYLKISANVSLNWPSENNNVGKYNNCCSWDNVQCDKHGRVTKLYLGSGTGIKWPYGNFNNNNNKFLLNVTVFQPFSNLISLDLSETNFINGLIDKDGSTRLSTLKKLQYLNLAVNKFQPGYFSVAALTSLKELILEDCGLTNSSLEELANLKALQVLRLGSNTIHATMTGGICNLKNLQKLDLRENIFYGSNLSCLSNLTSLKYLDLSFNTFTGMLPSIKNLTSLEYLDLSDNFFEGRISLSSSLASLSNLKYLHLSRNWLEVQTEDSQWKPSFQLEFLGLANCSLNKPSGAFPKFLLHQYNLAFIDLSYNTLMGGFPTFLLNNNTHLTTLYLMNNYLTGILHFSRHTNFSSLDGLSISRNYFYGQLPNNFGYIFPNFEYLNMSGNHFEGHIPTSIGLMRALRVLDLSNNNFSGELPRQLLSIESLEYLVLSNNNLQGEIVPDYMSLPNLQWLKLSNNNFTGTINKALLESYYYLNYLDLSLNRVTGQISGWIEYLSKLQTFSVSQNFLQGQIPSEICHLVKLNYLDLSQNNFTGTIPSCSNYTSLYYLHLHQNSLTGGIPNGLSNCTSLETLDLRGNKLSGTIPFWISNLANLIFLLLGGNDMRGNIPKELCELGHLNILDLSNNKFSGEIPTCIGNNSFGLISTWDSLNKVIIDSIILHGEFLDFPFYPIDSEVKFLAKNQDLYYKEGSLHIVSGLDLSCNNFSGVIPTELGFLTQIYSLNLSHNFLSGPIPQNLSNLKQIESLDLSFNNLSGNIPSGLVDLNFLEVFNVSYNNLIGKVPDTGQFSSFDKSSYLGNMGLCGSTMDKPCDPINNSSINNGGDGGEGEGGSGVIDMVEFFWSFGMSCVVIFFSTQVILYVNSRWREAWFRFVDWHILWWFPM